MIYSNWTTNQNRKETFFNFAQDQMDYVPGDNPYNKSYMVGFGDKGWFNSLHHRGAQGPWAGFVHINPTSPFYLQECRHILYGAIPGGPDLNDNYKAHPGDSNTTLSINGYRTKKGGVLNIIYHLAALMDGAVVSIKSTDCLTKATIKTEKRLMVVLVLRLLLSSVFAHSVCTKTWRYLIINSPALNAFQSYWPDSVSAQRRQRNPQLDRF